MIGGIGGSKFMVFDVSS